MNNLINITNKDGKLTVSSREVAERFEKRHDHVLRDVEALLDQNPKLGADYFIESSYKAGTGKPYKQYELTRDGFSLLAMGFTGAKALEWKLKFIEAFNKMEESIKSAAIPEGKYLLALAVLESNKVIEEQDRQIKELIPKAVFADSVAASTTTILIGELAKILKQNGVATGQNRLFEWMRQNGYLINRKGTDYSMPTQRSMEMGLFEIKETSVSHSDGHITVSKTPKVTGKGQIYFINKLKPAVVLVAE
ncbi:phage regulatory protein/antirepressor Ant [Acetobacterium wieringae]|uniref:phage regulatory protein/antirepressor Ant n=1 Tax=Acetobacterium wieringae TaxID=52694 RepID=UPI002B209470|nr:phage regulatory protein/antirepressor Ant [Acetobacterium wieringae]MEA4805134.1 phage regulatory protein/antirepressor Ant [Acetobacterium wieringae]